MENVNWDAYELGSKAWDNYIETGIKQINPFKENTNEFYSWRRGWNTNFNGITK